MAVAKAFLVLVGLAVWSTEEAGAWDMAQRHFFRKSLLGKVWHKYVERTAPVAVASSAECSGYCQANRDTCDIFIKDGETCYLGRYGGSFSHIADPGHSANVYIDTSIDLLAGYIRVAGVPSSAVWSAQVSSAAAMSSSSSLDSDCMDLCEREADFACDIFVKEEARCHYGRTDNAGGSGAPQDSAGPWTIYVNTESFVTAHDGKVSTLASRSLEAATSFVYRTPASPISAEQCGLQCVYSAEPSPCHFYLYDGSGDGMCRIGSFSKSGTLVSGDNVDVKLNFGAAVPFFAQAKRTVSGDRFADLLFATRSNPGPAATDDDVLAVCAAFCLTEPGTNKCHFFIRSGNTCYLGDLEYSGTPVTPPEGSQDNHIISIAVDGSGHSDSSYWSVAAISLAGANRRFTGESLSAYSAEQCAALCTLNGASPNCNVFYFDGAAGKCWFGNVRYNNPDPVNALKGVTAAKVFVAKPARTKWIHPLFQENPQVPGATWSSKVYKKVAAEWGSDHRKKECQILCYLDGGPCHTFVYDDSFCYLGAWHVDAATVVQSSEAKTVYEWRATVGLFHGGYEDFPEPRFADLDAFTEEQGTCAGHGVPDFPQKKHAHAVVYAEPNLLLCGGYYTGAGSGQIYRGKWCKKMDLDAPERAWVNTDEMASKRIHFPLVVLEDDPNSAYAIGGQDETDACLRDIEKYDVAQDSWVQGFGILPEVGRYHSCAVAVGQEVWIVGGLGQKTSCDAPLDRVDVWKPSDNTWRSVSPFPIDIYHAYCGAVKSTSDDHDWVLVAGGYDNGYFDATAGTGWTTLANLPLHMGWNGYTNSIMVMSRTEMYIVGVDSTENGKGTNNVLVWNDDEKKFRTTDLMAPSKIRQWPGAAVVPLSAMWNCMRMSDEWELVLSQDSAQALFSGEQWARSDPGAFSKLDQIANYKSCEGKYHFRLMYPELGHFNEWYQTNNPKETTAVTGYQAVGIKYATDFVGLRAESGGNALLYGDAGAEGDPAGYYVGAKVYSVESSIAGPKTGAGAVINTHRVDLYAKKDC